MSSAEAKQVIGVSPRQFAVVLGHPSTLLLIAANSVPIWGVLFWGWDVFVLLILYWLETAIIGFWMIARIVCVPIASLGTIEVNGKPVAGIKAATARLFVAGFFVVHAGIFMGVHMVFLWSMFSGEWSKRIHGLGDFINRLIIDTDMWGPLLVLFLVRGLSFLFHVIKPKAIENLERSFGLPVSSVPAPEDIGSIVGAFYGRVVVMHMTIIFSAFISVLFGSIAPLIVMVAVKTVADVSLHVKYDFSTLQKASQTLTAVTRP